MKKIFALLLAVLLCVTVFVACGADADPTTTEAPTTTETPTTTEAPYTPAWSDNTTLDVTFPDFN